MGDKGSLKTKRESYIEKIVEDNAREFLIVQKKLFLGIDTFGVVDTRNSSKTQAINKPYKKIVIDPRNVPDLDFIETYKTGLEKRIQQDSSNGNKAVCIVVGTPASKDYSISMEYYYKKWLSKSKE